MGYTIVRIDPVGNATKQAKDCEPKIAQFTKRSRLGEPRIDFVRKMLRPKGFDVEMGIGPGTWAPNEWPFTAFVYTSKSKEGIGRCGSSLYRWPCRRSEVGR